MKEVVIRNAMPADARAIKEVQDYMWKKTYSHLLPEQIFESREKNKEQKIKELTERIGRDNSLTFVVQKKDEIVGMARAATANDLGMGDDIPQLFAMYFKEEIQGFGISLELAKVIAKKFLDMGYTQMVTACLQGNKFNDAHIALGGKKVKEMPMEKLNGALENVYFYDDLNKIVGMTMKDAIENIKQDKKKKKLLQVEKSKAKEIR